MTTDLGLQVVKNKKTGALFVFVEDKAGINIAVISPEGQELQVPSVLFDDKRRLTSVEIQSELTEAQIRAINSQKPKEEVVLVLPENLLARRLDVKKLQKKEPKLD